VAVGDIHTSALSLMMV